MVPLTAKATGVDSQWLFVKGEVEKDSSPRIRNPWLKLRSALRH
jgi:hypothetical protein